MLPCLPPLNAVIVLVTLGNLAFLDAPCARRAASLPQPCSG
jgi:hypothetical protein